jgi:hypothetical protein
LPRDAARHSSLPDELDREFAVVCFAWPDEVADERSVTRGLRSVVERLTALGVDVAILGRFGVREVDQALGARPGTEGRLFLLLSRGAEVYVVGPRGPRLLERRRPTRSGAGRSGGRRQRAGRAPAHARPRGHAEGRPRGSRARRAGAAAPARPRAESIRSVCGRSSRPAGSTASAPPW